MSQYDEYEDYERPRRRRQPDPAALPPEEFEERPRRRREPYDDAADRREALMARRMRSREEYDEYDDYDGPPLRRPGGYNQVRGGAGAGRQQGGSGCVIWALYGLLTLAAISFAGYLILPRLSGTVAEGITAPIREIIITPTPTVFDRGGAIRQIRALNRLETQNFSAERIVEASVERGNILDNVLGQRLLLIASGDVVAGVDLSKLKEGDITISEDGKTITMQLPPTEIFRASLDNGRTRVYDVEQKILTQLTGSQDPNLETQARQSAEGEILKAACEYNITQKAATEAKKNMEQFLSLLQFENITVTAPAGACVAPTTGAIPAPTLVLPTTTP